MAYSNNIPLPTDKLSQSQADLLNNFIAIKQLIDINHVTFGDPDEGKHYKIEMPVQNPEPAISPGEVGLYNFLNPSTTANELYVRKGAANGVPMTAYQALSGTNGWTIIPSGIMIKWGFTANILPNPGTITMGGPLFSAIYSVQLTPVCSALGVDLNWFIYPVPNSFNAGADQFQVAAFNRTGSVGTPAAVQFYYLVIGLAA